MAAFAIALTAILALAPSAPPAQDRSPTLGELVAKLGTDTTGLPTNLLGMRMTSYATFAQDSEFGFAGYKDDGTNVLSPPLYVGWRERAGPWRVAAVTERGPHGHFGSAMDISPIGSLLIVNMHLNPSAGEMIVLRRDLTYVTRLYGWFWTSLPDGLVIFHRSMIHFAPAHPGELAMFDPVTGVEAQLYPIDKASPVRKAFIDRLRPIYQKWEKREKRESHRFYGFDPEWFDVYYGGTQCDAAADTLTIGVTFRADRHPAAIAPRQIVRLTVTCGPMRSPSRLCIESR